MPHPTARLVVVTLACVAATGCLRTQVEPGPATDTILHLVARPARPVPAGPPASNLHWRGRSETQHTWIVVEADVADGKVTHFRFDTGCIGQDKSLVGWSPHGQVATIRTVGDFYPNRRGDMQGIEFLAARGVPHLDRTVRACGNEAVPIGGVEGHVRDRAGVSVQREMLRSRFALQRSRIPDADRFIYTGRGQLATIGTEGHEVNVVDVAAQGEDLFSGCRVPELDSLIQSA